MSGERTRLFEVLSRLPARVWIQAILALIVFVVLAVLGFAVIAGVAAVALVLLLGFKAKNWLLQVQQVCGKKTPMMGDARGEIRRAFFVGGRRTPISDRCRLRWHSPSGSDSCAGSGGWPGFVAQAAEQAVAQRVCRKQEGQTLRTLPGFIRLPGSSARFRVRIVSSSTRLR